MSLAFSLEQAAKLALHNGADLTTIRVEKWAATYRATVEEVRRAFEKAAA